MKIFVKAKPNSKKDHVERLDENHFEVRVKARPEGGRANEAVIAALAEYFDMPKSRFTLLKGHTSKNKVIDFNGI